MMLADFTPPPPPEPLSSGGVLANYVLISALLAFALAQFSKLFTSWYKEKRWDLKQLVGSGGMPSSHSATVSALAAAVGYHDGTGGSLFAVALVLACVVMYDATGVRLQAGRQAERSCTCCTGKAEISGEECESETGFAGQNKENTKETQSLRHLKLSFPVFKEGSDPLEWLRDCEEYFAIYDVCDGKKSAIAAMHLSGIPRFGELDTNLVFDKFKTLLQTSSVEEYFDDFERSIGQVLKKIPSLTMEYLEKFIGGLQNDIKGMIWLLEQALKLARYYEQNLHNQPRKYNSYGSSYKSGDSSTVSAKAAVASNGASASIKSPLLIQSKNPEVESSKPRPLTYSQREERRQKRLEIENEYEGAPKFDEYADDTNEDWQDNEILLSALKMEKNTRKQPLQYKGTCNGKEVKVLIDGGNTGNLVSTRLCANQGIQTEEVTPVVIMLPNGDSLSCSTKCPDFTFQIDQETFNIEVWKEKEVALNVDSTFELKGSCHNMIVVTPVWMEQLIESYEDDEDIKSIIGEVAEVKGETVRKPGLLQPSSISQEPWREIAMDFITGLPKSQGFEVIWVVVDRFSRHIPGQGWIHTNLSSLEAMLTEKQQQWSELRELLETAPVGMKSYADSNRSERVFAVGDWVYLKLQPYRQVTVAIRKNLKLSAKFFGPYEILEKIGSVAYKLGLPEISRVHPVFHVSQLKRAVGQAKVHRQLPQVTQHGTFDLSPRGNWTVEVLNQIVYELPSEHPLAESRPLHELLGHTPPQVIAGGLLGIITATFVHVVTSL
ncbi:hypothetical protein AgCh_018182 [Apium graveolens]